MRKTYYFSHDYNARNDPKMIKLLMNHGIAGIGIFWNIAEMLYEQNGYLEISEYNRIAFELRTDENIIKEIIEKSGLFKLNATKFFSESILRRLKMIKNKSEQAKKSVGYRWEKQRLMKNTNVLQTYNDSNTNKVKESKVNKSKIKEDKKPKISFSDESLLFVKWFKKLITENYFPKNEKQINDWRECYDKLIKIDKRTKDEIKAVCEFARNDEFWSGNFFTPLKLRKKSKENICYFDMINEKLKRSTISKMETTEDFKGYEQEISKETLDLYR